MADEKKKLFPTGRMILLAIIAGALAGAVAVYVRAGLPGNGAPGAPAAIVASADVEACAARTDMAKAASAEAKGEVAAMLAADPPQSLRSLAFNAPDGTPMTLADLSGRVLLVNLWATWCGPCRIEIPHLIEISKEFKSKGVEVLGLTTEEKSEVAAEVDDFVKNFEIPYAVGWANPQIQRAVLGNAPSIPQSIIIGKDGKIYRHLIGFNPRLTPPQLRSAVEEALAQ